VDRDAEVVDPPGPHAADATRVSLWDETSVEKRRVAAGSLGDKTVTAEFRSRKWLAVHSCFRGSHRTVQLEHDSVDDSRQSA
jgi:hypothetical protein